MSWLFSRALVEEFSAATCSAGDASAQSNTTPTPVAFYWPDKTTEHSRLFRFGMTCEPLTAGRGEVLLTWFLEASLVRISAPQGEVTDSTGSAVGCGRKWLGLLARYDHGSHSWRTPQSSLVEGLDEFSETWPRWGSMRSGESWERMTAVASTVESGSGLWPTPNCNGYRSDGELLMLQRNCKTYQAYRAMSERAAASKRDRFWMPEPYEPGFRLSLNWSEQLMGWPIGQTALKPLEMARFREWRQQHSECSQANSEVTS
jgi:hypothetical protein